METSTQRLDRTVAPVGGGADHAVVIVGGGPTGLMLAAELAIAGVDVAIVERRARQALEERRAGGLHARSLEVLDQRGVVDRFLAEGQQHPAVGYGGMMLDITDAPTRHRCVLALWQPEIERLLAEWVAELGVPTLRGREVTGVSQDDTGVEVRLADRSALRAAYLVGCDGGRSAVRSAAGIGFIGTDPTTSWLIAEVGMTEAPPLGMRPEGGGIGPVDRERGGSPYAVVVTEPTPHHEGAPTPEHLRAALVAAYGSDFGAHSPTRLSRFTDATRQAVTYRHERVLLAGDAAHVHPPHGGQGLNTGVQDAVNLGWKLAQVVRGVAPDSLLDTYHSERHPVGAGVLRTTMAQVALAAPGETHQALRDTMAELLAMDEPRRRMAARIAGLDVRYDLGDGHPLVGRRMPDLDLATSEGATRVYALLHEARPVLLDLGGGGSADLLGWGDRVRLVSASLEGELELPVVGEVSVPPAILVRPDGHVGWAGAPSDAGLHEALERWCGAPAPG
jgi:3-(3-hydroxy-phenyl)propionate hydroxylase